MLRKIAFFAGVLLAPTLGLAAPAQVSVVTAPDWDVRPSSEMMERHFPPIAVTFGISGSARITCKVKIDHTLTDCRVIEERPEGLGFGKAAVETAQEFRMKPETRDGEPVEGASVTVPVMFPIVDDDANDVPVELVAGLTTPLDPTTKALAVRLIDATRDKDQDVAGLKQGFGRALNSDAAGSGVDPAALIEMQAALDKAIDHALAQFVQARADYLARAMSVDELKAAVAFFESDAGKAFVTSQNSRTNAGAYTQVVKSIQNEVAAAYCADHGCPKAAK
ncbi:MAG TPA: TonB family protein [Caulobacteraceae bacterium]|nr:TonB family protein [Caulobacteraceae bacterium]